MKVELSEEELALVVSALFNAELEAAARGLIDLAQDFSDLQERLNSA